MLSWLMQRLLSPFIFRNKLSSTSDARFLSNGSSKLDPHRHASATHLPQEHSHGVNTNSSQDNFSSQLIPLGLPSHSSSIKRHSPHWHITDVLSPGDVVGKGIPLRGESLRLVPILSAKRAPVSNDGLVSPKFQVIRKLGTSSHSIVYLVREILPLSLFKDDDIYPPGPLELDDSTSMHFRTKYGRECATELISKADLDENELFSVLTEAAIHQSVSVRPRPNIVTLHHVLGTSTFLLLLLEFVPGEKLSNFLKHARDRDDVDPILYPYLPYTPPTSGLPSSLPPSPLFSSTRLRLIASMLSQMCEAVASCHDTSVFFRGIRPGNFIVRDSRAWNQDSILERRVIVKLCEFSQFGHCADLSDIDVPYMSYECRNTASVYGPRAADIWSLGIVLINMLYHRNPWMDTAKGVCPLFKQYLSNQTNFFMQRFAGMTLDVATFLVENVFCILDDPTSDFRRIGAREFGRWVRDLPTLMTRSHPVGTHTHPSKAHSSKIRPFMVPVKDSNPTSAWGHWGDVSSVGNDEEHDNFDEFVTVSAISTNGPRSSKTASHTLSSISYGNISKQ